MESFQRVSILTGRLKVNACALAEILPSDKCCDRTDRFKVTQVLHLGATLARYELFQIAKVKLLALSLSLLKHATLCAFVTKADNFALGVRCSQTFIFFLIFVLRILISGTLDNSPINKVLTLDPIAIVRRGFQR